MADQTPPPKNNELVAIAIAEDNIMPQQQQPPQQQQQPQQQQHQPVQQQNQQNHHQQERHNTKSKPKNFLSGSLSGAKRKSALMRIITFILSLPLLGIVIFLVYQGEHNCENLVGLRKLRTWIIVGLVLVFLLTTVTVFFLKDIYALPGCMLAILVFLTFLYVGIGLVSTGQGDEEGRNVPASPGWIVRRVNRIYYWNDLKHCIYETRDCDDLIALSLAMKSYDYTGLKLTPLQSGCCKPPQICEMEYVNSTYWKKTAISSIYVHKDNPYFSDCDIWQNNSTVLCYDCQTCKDAYSSLLGSKWRKLGIFLVTMSTLLFISHIALICFTLWERFHG